jgi:hypothetical protein
LPVLLVMAVPDQIFASGIYRSSNMMSRSYLGLCHIWSANGTHALPDEWLKERALAGEAARGQ